MCNKMSLGVIVLIFCQFSRVWTHKECGLLDSNNKNVLPWVANIYQVKEGGGYEFICSGTLVSRKIILTAARCFYDDLTKEIKNAKFVVSIGQNYKAWDADGNPHIQTREIPRNNIIISNQYKGIMDNYSCNIALVKLNADQKFNLNEGVKRACVYWDNDFVDTQFEVNPQPLKVVVWDSGKNSTFTVLEPSYVNFDLCYSLVAKDFTPFLTFDKMCASVSGLQAASSIGSGLYALNAAENRWYLIGVASEMTTADSNTYMTVVKMQPHFNWLSNNAFMDVR